MSFDAVMKRAAISATVDLSLKGIENDPRRSMKNAVDLFGHLTGEIFGESLMARIRREAENPKSCFYRMVTAMVRNVDHSVLKTVGTDLCYNRVALPEPPAEQKKGQAPGPAPKKPGTLAEAVRHARGLGICFFVLCGDRPFQRREEILSVCRQNRDCAFYLATETADIDAAFAEKVVQTGNIILAVRIDTSVEPDRIAAGCSGAFQILKKEKCLYGYIAEIGSSSAKACLSDGFIDCMAKYGCLFGWYYAGTGKERASCRQAIARLMESALTSRSKPLLLLDPLTDRSILRRFVAGGRCYLSCSGDRLAVRCRPAAKRQA